MDKGTFCAGGPEKGLSKEEFAKYGAKRLAQGKLPACAEMCSTKALLGGDGDVIADIYRQRVLARGKGSEVWGWGSAYGRPEGRSAAGPSQRPRELERTIRRKPASPCLPRFLESFWALPGWAARGASRRGFGSCRPSSAKL